MLVNFRYPATRPSKSRERGADGYCFPPPVRQLPPNRLWAPDSPQRSHLVLLHAVPGDAVLSDAQPRIASGPVRLRSPHSQAIRYFAGSALVKSVVSSSGVLPAGTPFFCNRNAMISTDLFAETEPGADIGIVVCTSDHSVEAFFPA